MGPRRRSVAKSRDTPKWTSFYFVVHCFRTNDKSNGNTRKYFGFCVCSIFFASYFFFSVNFSYYLVLIQCFFGPLKCLRSALHIKLKIGILCVCLSFVFFSSGRSLEEKRAWIFSKKARIEATTCCILLCVNLELNCTTIYAYSMNKTKTLDHNRN